MDDIVDRARAVLAALPVKLYAPESDEPLPVYPWTSADNQWATVSPRPDMDGWEDAAVTAIPRSVAEALAAAPEIIRDLLEELESLRDSAQEMAWGEDS